MNEFGLIPDEVNEFGLVSDEFGLEPDKKQRSGPGDSPGNPIDQEHPDLPFMSRVVLKNLAGPDDETGVRFLHSKGFEAVPRGAYNYSVKKIDGDDKWYVLDPSEAEVKDVTTDIAGDMYKMAMMGLGFVGGGALGLPTTGPGAIGTAAAGGAVGAGVAETSLLGLGKLAGVDPSLKEAGTAVGSEMVLGGAFGGGGQALSLGAKAAAPYLKPALKQFRLGQRGTEESIRKYVGKRAMEGAMEGPEESIKVISSKLRTRPGGRKFEVASKRSPQLTGQQIGGYLDDLSDRALKEHAINLARSAKDPSYRQSFLAKVFGAETRDQLINAIEEAQPGKILGKRPQLPGWEAPPLQRTVKQKLFGGKVWERTVDIPRKYKRPVPPTATTAQSVTEGWEPSWRSIAHEGIESVKKGGKEFYRRPLPLMAGQAAKGVGHGVQRLGKVAQFPMEMAKLPLRWAQRWMGKRLDMPFSEKWLEGPIPGAAAALGGRIMPYVGPVGLQLPGALDIGGRAVVQIGKVIAGDTTGATIRRIMMHPRLPAAVRGTLQALLKNWQSPRNRQVAAYLIMRNAAFRRFITAEYSA